MLIIIYPKLALVSVTLDAARQRDIKLVHRCSDSVSHKWHVGSKNYVRKQLLIDKTLRQSYFMNHLHVLFAV